MPERSPETPAAPSRGGVPILRGMLDAARRRYPRACWRVRTAASLAAWDARRARGRPGAERPTRFDADFRRRHEAGDREGGGLHVNERPPEHWIGRSRRMGDGLAPQNDAVRRDVAALDLPREYAVNVNAFVGGGA
jgi:hypothetical protein